jgi:hypothetical protein
MSIAVGINSIKCTQFPADDAKMSRLSDGAPPKPEDSRRGQSMKIRSARLAFASGLRRVEAGQDGGLR